MLFSTSILYLGDIMRTVTDYSLIPSEAAYLGSEHGDGSMDEAIMNYLDEAIEPICFRDEDGIRHYFELQP
jgi:hypothetical protein